MLLLDLTMTHVKRICICHSCSIWIKNIHRGICYLGISFTISISAEAFDNLWLKSCWRYLSRPLCLSWSFWRSEVGRVAVWKTRKGLLWEPFYEENGVKETKLIRVLAKYASHCRKSDQFWPTIGTPLHDAHQRCYSNGTLEWPLF